MDKRNVVVGTVGAALLALVWITAGYASSGVDRFSSCGKAWWKLYRGHTEREQLWLALPRQDEIVTYDTDGDGKPNAALVVRSESPMEGCSLEAKCGPTFRLNSVDFFTLPDKRPIILPEPWCGGVVIGIQWTKCAGAVACLDVHERMFDGSPRIYRITITTP